MARSGPLLIAHRGASAYAPEHTVAAYRLALAQGADFIEPDLQMTSDGVLIALHDLTLDRTTNVEEVFPDRYREETLEDRTVRRWHASDFTFEEIRSLDAGAWFDEAFAGERIPTFAEVVELARGQAGVYPETKAPEVYGALGLDMERSLVEALVGLGLADPESDPDTPVVIQSFSPESLRILRHELGLRHPQTLLVGNAEAAERWLSEAGLDEVRAFAEAIGPSKGLLLANPAIVTEAHARGLQVVPYTFRASNPGAFPNVQEEMAHFLDELGVDALFTDNPDLFPREIRPSAEAGP